MGYISPKKFIWRADDLRVEDKTMEPKMRCTTCNMGTYEKKKVPYLFLGENLGTFEALVCRHCGETLFESAASGAIEAEVKKRGLWGLRARSKVSEVGNALDVRIPKALAQFLSLEKGTEVILEPIDKNRLQIIVG